MNHELLRDDDGTLRDLITATASIAVLGASATPDRAGYYVPAHMRAHGARVVGVNPALNVFLGQPAIASLADLPHPVDMVLIFRRSELVPDHIPEILAMNPLPRVAWLQLGVRSPEAADALTDAGVHVIQDRCLLVEHRRLA